MQKLTVMLFVVLAGAALARPATPGAAELRGLSARQALAKANQWRGAGGLQSHVTSQAVVFNFPGGEQKAVPLPATQMVVAVAPYIHQTHPCKTHFMSGCQGELVNVPVKVVVRNTAGKTVVNQTMRTLPNGFLELWLPRNQEYRVTLRAQGKTAAGVLGTAPGSDTCITTLRLR